MYERKRMGALLSVCLLAVVVLTMLCASGASADEFRGWWIDAWHSLFSSQSAVDALLGVPGSATSKGTIRNANLNAVVVQVRRRADTCYPSGMGEPYMSGQSPSNFNALQAIINAAHDTTGGKQRIEVHCWIVTFATAGGAVYAAHHATPTGSLTTFDNYWPTRDTSGAETSDYAFDPGHPNCEQYIVNVAMDLVNNFDIDGIHYDYIRYTANNQGYNPTSIARYNARYGTTGNPSSTSSQFQQWRRDQVSAVVRKVYAKIQASKPWVKQTGAFVTWNPSPTASTRAGFQATRPYYDVYSDWDSWMQEGIVDAAIPMTYYDLGGSWPADWTRWINFEKNRHGSRHMYIGPGTYLNSQANAITELLQTRTASPTGNYADGFSGYDYYTPYSGGSWTSAWSTALTSQVTPTKVNVPVMSWKASPTKGHISGTVTITGTGAWADGANVAITGPESKSMLCDGTGFYSFIDLTPGTYTVTASKSGYPNATTTVDVAVGAVTGNMYVANLVLGGTDLVISNVQASSITTGSALITWTTNLPASSQVEYGLTTGYGSATTLDSGLVTSHSQSLVGLVAGTVYHYRVKSAIASGSKYSADYTFTTVGPPKITNVASSAITGSTATITWTTDQTASSQVQYGLTTSYGSTTTLDSTLLTSHSQGLSGLAPGTPYHYCVVSANVNGSTTSSDYTFTTVGPPAITNVASSGIGANSATITWTTDQASSSQVEYGPTTSYGSTTTLDSNAVTSHSVALSGLAAGSPYHSRVKSGNANGTTTSNDYTFTTNGDVVITSVQATGITSTGATITWTTNFASSSQVEYGTTTSYGSSTTLDSSLVTSHSVVLSGLSAGTPYHYRVKSADASGPSLSSDYTFTTTVPVSEIVVDNVDAGWRNTSPNGNTWSIGGTTGIPMVGTGYLWAPGETSTTETSATRKCTWTPTLPTAGLYDVYVFYQKGSNRTTTAPYTVYYYGGSVRSVQNQNGSSSTSGYFLAGQNLPFLAGTTGYVELTTLCGNTSVVDADAAKWVYKSALDLTPPTASIGTASAMLTRSGPIAYTIGYSDNVGVSAVTLAAANVTLNKTGTANGTVAVSGTGTATRTVTISGITGTGTLGISIAAGTAGDNAGNTAPAAGPSTTFSVDNTAPTMTSVTDEVYTTSTTSLQGWWSGTSDGFGMARYEYAVGTTSGGTDIKDWTDAGMATSVNIGPLPLTVGVTYYISARAVDEGGMTSEPMSSAGVRIARAVAGIQEAKGLADGEAIALPARVVSAKFAGKFYVEEANRVSGIRVESGDPVSAGQSVTVFGVLGLIDGAERAILSPKIIPGAAGTAIKPVILIARSAGGQALNGMTPGITNGIGLSNIGMLVRLAGSVMPGDPDGFVLDDGSDIKTSDGSRGIKVWTGTSSATSASAIVTGVVSCETVDGKVYPIILATGVISL